jgi:hypothetical protein
VSVSKRLDQLLHESFVADLGYPADQSMVARVVLGLQLLADEIDALGASDHAARPSSVAPEHCGTDRAPADAPEPGETDSSPVETQPAESTTAVHDTPPARMYHDSPIGVE